MEWQPVDAVPDDGMFLVYDGGAIRTMLRQSGKWVHIGAPVLVTEHGDRLTSPEVEQIYGRRLEISDCIYAPSHFMDLPDDPP